MKWLSDICVQYSSKSSCTSTHWSKATLSVDETYYTLQQTVQLSDKTARIDRLIWSYTVYICPKCLFRVTQLTEDGTQFMYDAYMTAVVRFSTFGHKVNNVIKCTKSYVFEAITRLTPYIIMYF